MVQNAAEGKKDVRSVTAEQGCSHTELLIVGDSNKLVYLTFFTGDYMYNSGFTFFSTFFLFAILITSTLLRDLRALYSRSG